MARRGVALVVTPHWRDDPALRAASRALRGRSRAVLWLEPLDVILMLREAEIRARERVALAQASDDTPGALYSEVRWVASWPVWQLARGLFFVRDVLSRLKATLHQGMTPP